MKNSVREEIKSYVEINRDNYAKNMGVDDLHFQMFNMDYYIIGYYQAEEWLKKHDISVFEGIGVCWDWERDYFGEVHSKFENAEELVNMLAYIWGYEVLAELQEENLVV